MGACEPAEAPVVGERNELRWNFTRIPSISAPESGAPSLESMGFVTGEGTLGINNSGPAGYTGVPSIGLNNFGFGSGSPSIQAQNTYQVGDSFSKVHGRHSIKLGGEFRYYQMNQRNSGGGSKYRSFDSATRCPARRTRCIRTRPRSRFPRGI